MLFLLQESRESVEAFGFLGAVSTRPILSTLTNADLHLIILGLRNLAGVDWRIMKLIPTASLNQISLRILVALADRSYHTLMSISRARRSFLDPNFSQIEIELLLTMLLVVALRSAAIDGRVFPV